jgi:hypothetical protein
MARQRETPLKIFLKERGHHEQCSEVRGLQRQTCEENSSHDNASEVERDWQLLQRFEQGLEVEPSFLPASGNN